MLFNELPITFPWYDKREQQNRYTESTEGICDYKLITPHDAMLPFQFVKPLAYAMPTQWEIYDINTEAKVADIAASIPKLRVRLINGKEYFTYNGAALTTGPAPLKLAPGFYYSRMYWAADVYRYSEMFYVPENSFNAADDDSIEYMRLEWYNDADLSPILYNDKMANGKPQFRNVAYLDTFITASEPELTEDGERDGNDELIPTFLKMVITYRVSTLVPDFLKKAMALIPMHDHFFLSTKYSVRTGEVQKATVNTGLEVSGALSTVDIIFQEIVMVKKGCGDNMNSDCTGATPEITSVVSGGGNYTITGSAPAGSLVTFYRTNGANDYGTIVGDSYSNVAFAAGVSIPTGAFYDSFFIKARAESYGCDFGFSNLVQKP